MDQEKKNERSGMLISISIHVIVLISFLFILAWRAPDPPLPEYGVELNFGLDNVGTGDVQPETPTNESESEEEAAPEELPEESTEEAIETVEEVVEEVSEPTEEVVVPVENPQESPDVVEEVKEEPKPKVEEKKEEKSKEAPKPPVEKEVTKPQDGADGKDGESKEVQSSNHGDNLNEQGDKGDLQGSLDSRALYGKSGGGGGSALDMTGWTWDFIPKPKDTSSETGRLVFEIKIDDQGEILSVRKVEGTVSPAVEKVYRAEVEKLTFSRTSDNNIVAPISTGKISFVIKSE